MTHTTSHQNYVDESPSNLASLTMKLQSYIFDPNQQRDPTEGGTTETGVLPMSKR